MPTPDELRQLATDVEIRAKAKAAELRRLATEMEAALKGLPISDSGLNMVSMETHTEGRRGPPITSDGPYAIAAVNSGESMFAIAAKLGVKYSALKVRNFRRSGPESDRKVLSKPPYSVPASAWKK